MIWRLIAVLVLITIAAGSVWYFLSSDPPPFNVNHLAVGDLQFRPVDLESSWGDAMPARAGTLVVPEDRADPDSNRIQIAFGVLATENPNPLPPILYLAGGPGVSGIDVGKSAYFYLFQEMHEWADVILLDQRGTGRSIPNLACPNRLDLPVDVARDVEAAITHSLQEGAAECATFFRKNGVNFNAYNSLSSARDIEDLRKALGYEQLTLFGTSYGTQLAQVYLRLHPDRVNRMILSGPVAPDLALKSPAGVHSQFEAMSRLIREDPAMRRQVPDLVALMHKVHGSLRRQPRLIKIPLMDAIDDTDGALVSAIFKLRSWFTPYWELTLTDLHLQMMVQEMVGDDSWIPRLPAFYYRIQQGDDREVGNMLRNFRRRMMPHGLLISVNCATSFTEARREQALLEENTTVLSQFGTGFGRGRDVCDAAGIERLGDDFLLPIRSSVPVLMVAGDLDGRTPLANVSILRERFPNHQTIIVHGSGHNALLGNAVKDAILAFLHGAPLPASEDYREAIQFESPVGYQRSLGDTLYSTINDHGIERALELYRKSKEDEASSEFLYDFREATLNRLGYRLLNENRLDAALAIFRLNTETYPSAFNTWDSLAEACLKKGDREGARRYYEKSLALNFFNGNAHGMLRGLQENRGSSTRQP